MEGHRSSYANTRCVINCQREVGECVPPVVERLPDHGADGEVVPAAARLRDLGDEIVPPPPRHPRTLGPPPDLALVIARPPALVKPAQGRSTS